MRAKCTNGCFEREIPEHLKDEIKKDERSLVCTFCWKPTVILIEDDEKRKDWCYIHNEEKDCYNEDGDHDDYHCRKCEEK